ncbi:multisubstrate pseudouridine synthase 7 [Sporothrix bragantina]|uniref:Multisubstrate pseudouridine synthase 7 n=1 Tax=Sporothrix bragantina TaxID=671064 RepID=A0ABP0BTD6_9PEZI
MANPIPVAPGNHLPNVRNSAEKKLGILHYTSCVDFGWHGDIRRRYTDFIVHEVRKDGSVVYLNDEDIATEQQKKPEAQPETKAAATPKEESSAPVVPVVAEKPAAPEVPPIDVDGLVALVGPDVAKQMQDAYAAIVTGGPPPAKFTIAVCDDRSKRGHLHQEIRRIFSGRFETRADGDSGAIVAMPAAGGGRRGGGRGPANGRDGGGAAGGAGENRREGRSRNANKSKPVKGEGKYLHFTMYKENKDTMEAINFLARMVKAKSSSFGFAGTKDRRAATTQRVSLWHNSNQSLAWINARSTFIKVGDFSFNKSPIQLGQHGGNDFVIVVKGVELVRGANCSLSHRLRMTETCVQAALDHVQQHGFINYFGLQRFGTHAIGTQEVGQKILSEDFEGACESILNIEAGLVAAIEAGNAEELYQRDEVNRARAILAYKTTGDLKQVLEILPRRFSAESAIMQHLGRNNANGANRDFCGALCRITRGLRNLYIHAYQSLVWNWATSQRWSRYGDKVVAGDLVLVESEANPSRLRQDGHDMSEDLNQEEEQFYQEARVLSAEEAASGQYTIFDIVLPVPGFDVLYPDNDIGEFYTEFMGRPENGGLSPYNMRRAQKEFSLSGHYRKIMARFTAVPQFFVRPYTDDAEQMHPTDLDDIKAVQEEKANSNKNDRRRRPSSDKPQGASEDERVNDAWVEKSLEGGGNKRVKMDTSNENNGTENCAATAASDDLPSVEDVTQAFNQGGSPREGSPMAVDSTTTVAPASASKPASAPTATTSLPQVKFLKNVFKTEIPPSSASSNTAINRTSAWRHGATDFVEHEDMEIAVALNFRLSSSNYATMCLREMMTGSLLPNMQATVTAAASKPASRQSSPSD